MPDLAPSAERFSNKIILIVDDNPNILRFTRLVLSTQGFGVQDASDGVEGLQCYYKHRDEILLVMIDIVMPRMNGLELAATLREMDSHLPILLITGHSEFESEVNESGMFLLLRKPFFAADLVEAVRGALNAR